MQIHGKYLLRHFGLNERSGSQDLSRHRSTNGGRKILEKFGFGDKISVFQGM